MSDRYGRGSARKSQHQPRIPQQRPPGAQLVYADVMPYAKLWDNNEAGYMTYADQVLSQLIPASARISKAYLKEASDGIDKALNEWRAENA